MEDSDQIAIAVVGAGIAGITTAYNLAKRGCRVTVYERHPYAAMETSFANGCQLSASNAEVWNSWATVSKGLKWVLTPGAPLLINPKPSWQKLYWMARFIAAIPKYEENTITTARLAIESRARLLQIAEDERIDFDCERRGILHFCSTEADFAVAKRVTTLLCRAGLDRRPVTPSEIRAIEPTLRGSVVGGFYTPSDFTGDIHKFAYGLANACQRLGVILRFSTDVIGIEPRDKTVRIVARSLEADSGAVAATQDSADFDRVVICGGVSSRQLSMNLGDRVNVYPVKGYSITVNLADKTDQDAAPWTSLLDDQAKIVASRLGPTRFRVAGTAEFNGNNKDIKFARIAPLIAWCRQHFPGMSTRQTAPWAGLRPMMPNMLPFVSRGRHPRVFYNTGHRHLGWTLSAATADIVAALVTQ